MHEPGFIELIEVVCPALEAVGVLYAITGSVASTIHGEPFTSSDIDIAVRMTPQQAELLAEQLPPRFYRDRTAMVDAVLECGLINLIDNLSPWKVDLCQLKPEPFHSSVFARRQAFLTRADRPPIWVVSPEDVILMKLRWRIDSRSEKQWNNALSVARAKGARLDWTYLRHWARELGVEVDLEQLFREAGI